MKKLLKVFSILLASAFLFGCSNANKGQKSIAVFVPGIMDDSPIYAKLANGVKKAVEEYNTNKDDKSKCDLFIMEAGTNQAEWSDKIISLASTGRYEVIISSNPSLPDLVEPIITQFPTQKFILLDAEKEGNQNINTVCYNQYEQAYITGYIAGLITKSNKLALIAAQEYPVMNNILLPYFEKGAKDSNSSATVDFRIVGNWYDATKGAELTDAVIKNGVDVILPICGGAATGVISSAKNNGAKITWFDDSGFSRAPDTIVSSTTNAQDKMAYEKTIEYLNNQTPWGQHKMVGVKEGFVDFIQNDNNYIKNVPLEVRDKMAILLEEIRNGKDVRN